MPEDLYQRALRGVFVPRGETPPEEVRGWEKLPATLRLHGGADAAQSSAASRASPDPTTKRGAASQSAGVAPEVGRAGEAIAPVPAKPTPGGAARFRLCKRPPTPNTPMPTDDKQSRAVSSRRNAATGAIAQIHGHKHSSNRLTLAQVEAYVAANNQSSAANGLIVAQAFQESGFRPRVFLAPGEADSPRGLLQIKPAALAEVKKSPRYAQYSNYGSADLMDPAKNIQIATAYLQLQIDKAGGDVATAMGGSAYGTGHYNAIEAGADALRTDPTDFSGMVAAMNRAKASTR